MRLRLVVCALGLVSIEGRLRALAAPPAAPPAPEGFETLPVTSPGQVLMARRADVYYVVTDAPGGLVSDADPAIVARDAFPGAVGTWGELGGIRVVRFTAGDDAEGATGVIANAEPIGMRLAACQWGSAPSKEAVTPEARAEARRACEAALETLPGLAKPDEVDLPFTPPEGFKRGMGGFGLLYVGRAEDAAVIAADAPGPVDVSTDLQKVTEQTDRLLRGSNVVLNEVAVEKVANVDAVRFRGKMTFGSLGSVPVFGYLLPRGDRMMLLLGARRGEITPELENAVRTTAASVKGLANPPAPGAKPDAGVGGAAATPNGQGDGGDGVKTALLIGGLVVAAILLAFVFRMTGSGTRRRRG
jgi:hypothetical protein